MHYRGVHLPVDSLSSDDMLTQRQRHIHPLTCNRISCKSVALEVSIDPLKAARDTFSLDRLANYVNTNVCSEVADLINLIRAKVTGLAFWHQLH